MITLNGDSPMTISEGDSFTDPGAFSDGGETITVTGTVDPDVPGTYTLTYIAVDEAGNVGIFCMIILNKLKEITVSVKKNEFNICKLNKAQECPCKLSVF